MTLIRRAHTQETSAGFLCNETGIPDSKIYYALSELSKKGMIIVQEGTPNIYKSLHPKEAINNLKQQLVENLNQMTAQADSLADSLSPMFESVEGRGEIELAYVIRGQRNIIRKMKDLISSAEDEVVVFISEKDLLDELKLSIMKAKKLYEKVGFQKSAALEDLFAQGETELVYILTLNP